MARSCKKEPFKVGRSQRKNSSRALKKWCGRRPVALKLSEDFSRHQPTAVAGFASLAFTDINPLQGDRSSNPGHGLRSHTLVPSNPLPLCESLLLQVLALAVGWVGSSTDRCYLCIGGGGGKALHSHRSRCPLAPAILSSASASSSDPDTAPGKTR